MILLFLMAVTYNQDVAPILNQNCQPCHTENNVAPFPLTTYEEVRKHAKQIAEVTESHQMPPWLPKGDAFKDPRRLTQAQIAVLKQWSKISKFGG